MPAAKPYYAWVLFGAAVLCSILAIAYTIMARPKPVEVTSAPSSPFQVVVPARAPPRPPPPAAAQPAAQPAAAQPAAAPGVKLVVPLLPNTGGWWARWNGYNRWNYDDLHWGWGHRWDGRTDPWDHPHRWMRQKQCMCTKEYRPVCKGQRQWPNSCSAECDGVYDAGPCKEVRQGQTTVVTSTGRDRVNVVVN